MLAGTVEATVLILLVIVVFGPVLAERFRIPGLVGLIAGGMLFGPFMIGWLEYGGLVTELGAIGILYLMFLAGLSFNIRAFQENRTSAITYGLLGFFLPFLLSVIVVLGFNDEVGLLGAALIGAMWASNTLVAYPDVRAAGLQNNQAVSAAVSAGVVADLMSLTVLALATATSVIEAEPTPLGLDLTGLLEDAGVIEPSNPDPTLPLWLALPVLAGFCLWLLPKITNWFFTTVGRTRMQRFVFTLAGMAAGATVALLGGIEGLIGAFLAGLGMNRLVPAKGPLMDRLDFVGSAIFIPAFLVSIGLNIDPALLFDPGTIVLSLVFTSFVVVGKSSAAIVTALRFKYSWNEVGLMAALSFGQAASTLAIAQVGFELGMFGQEVVNAAVLTIVFTALLTSYGTRFFIRRVPRPVPPPARMGEMVLVDVRSSGSDTSALMGFAGAIAKPDDGLVVPYAVPSTGQKELARTVVDEAARLAAAYGLDSEGAIRVDDSFHEGSLSLAEETDATLVILSWQGPRFTTEYMFGNDIDAVGEACPVPAIAARLLRPWSRLIAVTGDTSVDWRKEDALLLLAAARRLRRSYPTPMIVMTGDRELVAGKVGPEEDVEFIIERDERRSMVEAFQSDDLVLVPAHVVHDLPPSKSWRVFRNLDDVNLAVIAGPRRLSVSKAITRHLSESIGHAQP